MNKSEELRGEYQHQLVRKVDEQLDWYIWKTLNWQLYDRLDDQFYWKLGRQLRDELNE